MRLNTLFGHKRGQVVLKMGADNHFFFRFVEWEYMYDLIPSLSDSDKTDYMPKTNEMEL